MGSANKTALVIGGNDGIGKAVAERFVTEGIRVVIFARREEQCRSVVEMLNAIVVGSSAAAYVSGDITSEQDLKRAVEKAVERFGRLDILVNVAAAQSAGTVMDATVEDYRHMFGVNVMGYGLAAKAAIPQLLKSNSAAIINIASLNGCIGVANRTLYNCSKAAVIEMTKSIACDYPSIRVNSISPGFTASESMMLGLSSSGIDPQECADLMSSRILMKRMGKPGEIASVVNFLASDDASYITGENIIVDGGALCFGDFDSVLTNDPRFNTNL